MEDRKTREKVSSKELNRLIKTVLSSKEESEELEKELKNFSPETVAFLWTFVQINRASSIYLPLMVASTPVELFAKNLACLESDDRFYKLAAVSFILEREEISKVEGKERGMIKSFVESQKRNKEAYEKASRIIKAYL